MTNVVAVVDAAQRRKTRVALTTSEYALTRECSTSFHSFSTHQAQPFFTLAQKRKVEVKMVKLL